MTKFRTKKDASGKTIRYPVDKRLPGMSHAAAVNLEKRLRSAYPDERITITKVGSGRNKLYVPSIAYLSQRIRDAYPLNETSNIAVLIPSETYKILEREKKANEPIYTIFFAEDGDGLTVFGEANNGSFVYAIDWKGIDTTSNTNSGEIVRTIGDKNETVNGGLIATPMEINDRIKHDVDNIVKKSDFITKVTSYDSERIVEMLDKLPDSVPVEISYKNKQLSVFPLENSSDIVTYYATPLKEDIPISGYYKAGPLKSLFSAVVNSGGQMELGIGNSEIDNTLYASFPVYERLKGFYDNFGNSVKYAGNFTGIVLPYSSGNEVGATSFTKDINANLY